MTQLFEEGVTTPKFEDLVGEGKTYADNDAVAKAIAEKNRFIEQLKQEARQAREDLISRINKQEAEDRLNSLDNVEPPNLDNQTNDGVKPEKVNFEELVAKELDKREAQRRTASNLETVKAKFVEVFGDDYATSVKQRAQELGIPLDFLEDAAKRSPQAVFAALGLAQQQKKEGLFTAPPQGHSFTPRTGSDKNYAYFNKLRKESPKDYYSPKVQNEMHRLAAEQGEAFYKE